MSLRLVFNNLDSVQLLKNSMSFGMPCINHATPSTLRADQTDKEARRTPNQQSKRLVSSVSFRHLPRLVVSRFNKLLTTRTP